MKPLCFLNFLYGKGKLYKKILRMYKYVEEEKKAPPCVGKN